MRISYWRSDVCSSGLRGQAASACCRARTAAWRRCCWRSVQESLWSFAGLPAALPPGVYRIDQGLRPGAASRAALGWCLGSYAFTRYKDNPRQYARLVWPKAADEDQVTHAAEAIALVRDLINPPATDMGDRKSVV